MTDLFSQHPVFDRGFVELQQLMGDDRSIVSAARTSFLGESKGDEADKKLLFYLMRNHHTTPFEMVQMRLRIKAPVIFWWQWTRHRTQSMTLQSGRYLEFEAEEVYFPTVWRRQSASNKQGSDGVLSDEQDAILSDVLRGVVEQGFKNYQAALDMGVAKEMARFFLPAWLSYYTGVVSINAWNLMHLLQLRMDSHAQEEIRIVATAIYTEIFKPALPWTAEAYEKYILELPST